MMNRITKYLNGEIEFDVFLKILYLFNFKGCIVSINESYTRIFCGFVQSKPNIFYKTKMIPKIEDNGLA